MSEQKKNTRSSNPKDVTVRLASSIDTVVTLPKTVNKANDAIKLHESLKKEKNQSQ